MHRVVLPSIKETWNNYYYFLQFKMSAYVITWSDMNPSVNQNKALIYLIFFFLHQTSYDILMVMLVVANFANKNDAKKPKKMTATLAHGYSSMSTPEARTIQWILTWLRLEGFLKSLRPCALDESSLSMWGDKLYVASLFYSKLYTGLNMNHFGYLPEVAVTLVCLSS